MRRNCFDVYRCITKNKFRNLWFEFQVQKFHHTHTVAAIGLFVAQQPGYEAVTFQLQMNFPNRTLTDDSQTLMTLRPPVITSSAAAAGASSSSAAPKVEIDESQPTITAQITMADGSTRV